MYDVVVRTVDSYGNNTGICTIATVDTYHEATCLLMDELRECKHVTDGWVEESQHTKG